MRNTLIDSKTGSTLRKKFNFTTPEMTSATLKALTNSLTSHPLNSRDSILDTDQTPTKSAMRRTSPPTTLNLPLTGLLKEQLPVLRTKDNADHAGLSPQPVQLKEPTNLLETLLPHSLKNNLLIAQDHTETKDAQVELWTTLSNILNPRNSRLKVTTHTMLMTHPANMTQEKV